MHFTIVHHSDYRYDRKLFVEPQTLRLRPRDDAGQKLLDFQLQISPQPDGCSEFLDAEGNWAATFWFNELIDGFSIETRSSVETRRSNPYDFLLTAPGCEKLPASYPEELLPALASCLVTADGTEIARFAVELQKEAGNETLLFLDKLCQRIYTDFSFSVRHQGAPYPPEQTLSGRCGSCRDLSVLFIAACRQVGIAARFVSGYQEGDPDQDDRQLHAWAEVFLPGGGWRGYDPTLGLTVADRHVAVAASHHPRGAAPFSGHFRGTGAAAEFSFSLQVKVDS